MTDIRPGAAAAPDPVRPAPVGPPPRTGLRFVSRAAFVFGMALAVAAVALFVLAGANNPNPSWGSGSVIGLLLFLTPGVASVGVGAFLGSRAPSNAIGWFFLLAGLCLLTTEAATAYGRYGVVHPGVLPRPDAVDWIALWIWLPCTMLITTLVPLVYPDGRFSRRRRPWLVFTLVAFVVIAAGLMFQPIRLPEANAPNPFAIRSLGSLFTVLSALVPLVAVTMAGAIGALARRYRRSTGDERLQIKWFLFAVAVTGVVFLTAGLSQSFVPTDPPVWIRYLQDLAIFSFAGLPIATVIAIRKYRLYEIDVIVSKTVVYAALAAFITAVYVGIVVGIGSAFGSHGNRFLPVLAAAVIAVAFQPVRERARTLANRMVFGPRATPYEVLSRFADRMGTAYANEDVLPRMARTVGEGVGATRAEVWLRVGPQLRLAARHPLSNDVTEAVTVATTGAELPPFPGLDRAFEVRHQGELLGALGVAKPPAESLSAPEEALLQDLAAQAGLVLRNVALTSELLARLDELQASRQRIVAAQDTERCRLERNIHDGAQQQLVALSVKLRLADMVLDKDPAKSHQMLSELQHDTVEALDNLRDLARGIYPPLLADQGWSPRWPPRSARLPCPWTSMRVTFDAIRPRSRPRSTSRA